ncbi:hypothetical protein VTG60DRAFT_2282 [Thermothelomyces hinnuleus]
MRTHSWPVGPEEISLVQNLLRRVPHHPQGFKPPFPTVPEPRPQLSSVLYRAASAGDLRESWYRPAKSRWRIARILRETSPGSPCPCLFAHRLSLNPTLDLTLGLLDIATCPSPIPIRNWKGGRDPDNPPFLRACAA